MMPIPCISKSNLGVSEKGRALKLATEGKIPMLREFTTRRMDAAVK